MARSGRSAGRWNGAVAGAIAAILLFLLPHPCRATAPLVVEQTISRGVTIQSARFVGPFSTGSWRLLALMVRSDADRPGATVEFASVIGSRWSVRADLRAGSLQQVILAVPTSEFEALLSDARRWPRTRCSVKQGGASLAEATFRFVGPDRRPRWMTGGGYPGQGLPSGNGAAIEDDLDHTLLSVGSDLHVDLDASASLASNGDTGAKGFRAGVISGCSTEDFVALGQHQEFLDHVSIVFCRGADTGRWMALPGVRSWVESGGILAGVESGHSSWTPVGAGGIEQCQQTPDLPAVRRMAAVSGRHGRGAFSTVVSLRRCFPGFAVPAAPILTLIGLYVVIIPITFLALRRLRRREATWLALPVLSLLFTTGIMVVCYACKGVVPTALRFTVMEEAAPGTFEAVSRVSVFSPWTQTYNVTLPDGALAASSDTDPYGGLPVGWRAQQSLEEEHPSLVRSMRVPQWCSNTISYRSEPAVGGSIGGAVTYGTEAGWSIELKNDSSLSLEDCRIWTGDGWLDAGTLPAGGSRHLRNSRPLEPHPEGGQTLRERLRREEFSTLADSLHLRGMYLVGWSGQPLEAATRDGVGRYVEAATVDGAGRYEDDTVVVIPLDAAADQGRLHVPDGQIQQVRHSFPDSSSSDLVTLRLPVAARSLPDVVLSLKLENGCGTVSSLSIWNPATNGWEDLKNPHGAGKFVINLSSLSRYFVFPGGVTAGSPGADPLILLRDANTHPGDSHTTLVPSLVAPAAAAPKPGWIAGSSEDCYGTPGRRYPGGYPGAGD